MMNSRKMNAMKRIAFAAGGNNRKSFIEWSYYNQEILKKHELIAGGAMAGILEGTVGVPVTRLPEGAAAANHQLAAMIADQKIDILIFFWDPVQLLSAGDGIGYLHDSAVANNIITAANLATADFVLSSVLMDKRHTVPVVAGSWYAGQPVNPDTRQAVLKVNTIN